jgi:DNA polymerase III delta prime subunit
MSVDLNYDDVSSDNSDEELEKQEKKHNSYEDSLENSSNEENNIPERSSQGIQTNSSVAPTKKKLPWIEKYRPKTLDDIISHKQIMSSLKTFIKEKTFPHIMLYGPSGTGKTSAIKACARELYNEYYNFMVLELNASDNKGIDTVRKNINKFVTSHNEYFLPDSMKPIFKLVILDEIDAMTHDAQAILRNTIEEYSSTTRFCLICNYITKVNPALPSRCICFKFMPLDVGSVHDRLIEVCKAEQLKYEELGINAIVKISEGDMRKAINLLQSVNLTHKEVSEHGVYSCSNYCHPDDVEIIYNKLITLANPSEDLLMIKKKNKAKICKNISTNLVNETIDVLTKIIIGKNISVNNLLNELSIHLMNSSISDQKKMKYLCELAQLEYLSYIQINVTQQIYILVSIFTN